MAFVEPVTLTRGGISLVPLGLEHEAGLRAAALIDDAWTLKVTAAPKPDQVRGYIDTAQATIDRVPFAIFDEHGEIIGSTSYHDILPEPKRVEIGYTWYTPRVHRTHVNTTCKLMLLEHAFDTLGCNTVGLRTDSENFRSQAAIERLGMRKDGTIRGNALRRDGVTLRDTVMYSAIASEWPAMRTRLEGFLDRQREPSAATRVSAGMSTTIAALPVTSIAAAVDFYRDQFGFTSPHHTEDFAVLLRDVARIHLWASSDDDWRSRPDFVTDPVRSGAESFLAGTASVRVQVTNVDALFAELAPRGVLHPNTGAVTTTDFGTREFATLDHEGNLLEFFQRVE